MMLIWGCWLAFLLMNLLKQPNCSPMYCLHKAAMLLICAIFTYIGARQISGREANNAEEGLIQWTSQTKWLYPLYAAVAGFLGGFLGIGGGIVMSPLLLELGLVPEANQATSAMFVFLSSSLATMQFVLAGAAMPQYVAWFTAWVTVSTFVGQLGRLRVRRRLEMREGLPLLVKLLLSFHRLHPLATDDILHPGLAVMSCHSRRGDSTFFVTVLDNINTLLPHQLLRTEITLHL